MSVSRASSSTTASSVGSSGVDAGELEALDAHIRRLQAEIQHAHRQHHSSGTTVVNGTCTDAVEGLQEEEEQPTADEEGAPLSSGARHAHGAQEAEELRPEEGGGDAPMGAMDISAPSDPPTPTLSATPPPEQPMPSARPLPIAAGGLPPLSPRFRPQRTDSPPPHAVPTAGEGEEGEGYNGHNGCNNSGADEGGPTAHLLPDDPTYPSSSAPRPFILSGGTRGAATLHNAFMYGSNNNGGARGGSCARPPSDNGSDDEGAQGGLQGPRAPSSPSLPREGSGRHRSVSPPHRYSDNDDDAYYYDGDEVDGEPDAYEPSHRGGGASDSVAMDAISLSVPRRPGSSMRDMYAPLPAATSSAIGGMAGGSASPLGHRHSYSQHQQQQQQRRAQSTVSTYSSGVVYEAGAIDMEEVVRHDRHAAAAAKGGRGGRGSSPAAAEGSPDAGGRKSEEGAKSAPASSVSPSAAAAEPSAATTNVDSPARRRDSSPSSSSGVSGGGSYVRIAERRAAYAATGRLSPSGTSRSPARRGASSPSSLTVSVSPSRSHAKGNAHDQRGGGGEEGEDRETNSSNTAELQLRAQQQQQRLLLVSASSAFAAHIAVLSDAFAQHLLLVTSEVAMASHGAVLGAQLSAARAEVRVLDGDRAAMLAKVQSMGVELELLRIRMQTQQQQQQQQRRSSSQMSHHSAAVDSTSVPQLSASPSAAAISTAPGSGLGDEGEAQQQQLRSASSMGQVSSASREPSASVVSATTMGTATARATPSHAHGPHASSIGDVGGMGGRRSATVLSARRHDDSSACTSPSRRGSPSIAPARLSHTNAHVNVNSATHDEAEEGAFDGALGSDGGGGEGDDTILRTSGRYANGSAGSDNGRSSRSFVGRSGTVLRASHAHDDDDDEPAARVTFAADGAASSSDCDDGAGAREGTVNGGGSSSHHHHSEGDEEEEEGYDDDEPPIILPTMSNPTAVQAAAIEARDRLRAFSLERSLERPTFAAPPSTAMKAFGAKMRAASPSKKTAAAIGGRVQPSTSSIYAWGKQHTGGAAGAKNASVNTSTASSRKGAASAGNSSSTAAATNEGHFGWASEASLISTDPLRSEDLAALADFVAAVSETLAVPAEVRRELLSHVEANYGDKLRIAKKDVTDLRDEKMGALADSRRQRVAAMKLKERVAELERQLDALAKKHAPLVANYSAMQSEYNAAVKRQQRAEEGLRRAGGEGQEVRRAMIAKACEQLALCEQSERSTIRQLELFGRGFVSAMASDGADRLGRVVQSLEAARESVGSPTTPARRHDEERDRALLTDAERRIALLVARADAAEAEAARLMSVGKDATAKYLASLGEVAAAHEELAALSQQLGDAQVENEKLMGVIVAGASDAGGASRGEPVGAAVAEAAELTAELQQLRSQMEPLQAEVVSARRREAAVIKAASKDHGAEEAAEAMLKALQGENERLVGIVRTLQRKEKERERAAPISSANGTGSSAVAATEEKPQLVVSTPTLQDLAGEEGASSEAGGKPFPAAHHIRPVVIPNDALPPSSASTPAAAAKEQLRAVAAPITRDIAEDTLDFARKRLSVLEDALLRSVVVGRQNNSHHHQHQHNASFDAPASYRGVGPRSQAEEDGHFAPPHNDSPPKERFEPTEFVNAASEYRQPHPRRHHNEDGVFVDGRDDLDYYQQPRHASYAPQRAAHDGDLRTVNYASHANRSTPPRAIPSTPQRRAPAVGLGRPRTPTAAGHHSHLLGHSHHTAPRDFEQPTAAEMGLRGEMRHWHEVVLRTGGQLFPSASRDSYYRPDRPTYEGSLSPQRPSR